MLADDLSGFPKNEIEVNKTFEILAEFKKVSGLDVKKKNQRSYFWATGTEWLCPNIILKL